MVVARSESLEVVETVNSYSILGSVVTNGSGISGDLTLSDVICGFSTEQEAITTEDGISGEGRALILPINLEQNMKE